MSKKSFEQRMKDWDDRQLRHDWDKAAEGFPYMHWCLDALDEIVAEHDNGFHHDTGGIEAARTIVNRLKHKED